MISGDVLFYIAIPTFAASFILFYRFFNGMETTDKEIYLKETKSKIRIPLTLILFAAFFYVSKLELRVLIAVVLILTGLTDNYLVQKRLNRISFNEIYRKKLQVIFVTSEIGIALFFASYLVK